MEREGCNEEKGWVTICKKKVEFYRCLKARVAAEWHKNLHMGSLVR
jgi:hypothetical protein